MRKNTLVQLIKVSKGYNPNTSQTEEQNKVIYEGWANVNDLTTRRQLQDFGQVIKNSKCIRFSSSVPVEFNLVKIDNKLYELVEKVNNHNRTSFIVKEKAHAKV